MIGTFMKRYGVLFGLILSLLASACQRKESAPTSSKAAIADKITIISPHKKDIREEFGIGFMEYARRVLQKEVSIEWIDQGGTSDSMRFISSEFKRTPEGIRVDLFWGGGLLPYQTLKKDGLLQPIDVSADILKKIPQTVNGVNVYDLEKYWFGTALSTFGIIYNKGILNLRKLPTPQTWEDLTDPRFMNWFVSADPRHSGSAHMIYSIILQGLGWEKGWEIITRLNANAKTITRFAGDVPNLVATGDAAAGAAIDFYAWGKIIELSPDRIGFSLPKDQTLINPDSIAMLKGAPNPKLATEFTNYVLSEAGQRLWLLKAGAEGGPRTTTLARLSVQPGLYAELGTAALTANPFLSGSSISYNDEKAALLTPVLNDLIGALTIDTHKDLQSAWKAYTEYRGNKVKLAEHLFRVPLTEAEALELAAKYEDKILRNQKLNDWTSFAINKYSQVVELAKQRSM